MKLQLLAFVPLAIVMGCSDGRSTPGSLTGRVSYKGAPVTGGSLNFYGEKAGVYPATLKADGTYSVIDLPEETMTVTVSTESLNPNKKAPEYGGGKGGTSPVPAGAQASAGTYVKIPAKYAEKDKSGLTVKIGRGKQTHDFDLTD